MMQILLDYYACSKSYSILNSKNVVKSYVHIRPIFSCPVTYTDATLKFSFEKFMPTTFSKLLVQNDASI